MKKSTLLLASILLLTGLACDRWPNTEQATILFHDAMAAGDHKQAKRMLNEGADIEKREKGGQTVLIRAAATDDDNMALPFLLVNGADPNAQTHKGNTALHVAAAAGRIGHVSRLLKAGADPSLTNNDGLTARDLAEQAGLDQVVAIIDAN